MTIVTLHLLILIASYFLTLVSYSLDPSRIVFIIIVIVIIIFIHAHIHHPCSVAV